MSLDRFLQVLRLPAPPVGFEGAGFCAELRQEIVNNPTLHPDPAAHTTRDGLRTITFPAPGDRAAPALLASIRRAVAEYVAALAGEHPFVRARPERASLAAWAIILGGRGRQQLHHHPRSWLTGVFYVSTPEGRPRPGRIRLGPLPAWAGVDSPWGVREIEPEPGTLLLFPSFVPHETVPTESDSERISVAFDVNAVEP